MKKIAVIGLGYVGLPLALLVEEKGHDVIGIDLDSEKLEKLKNKICPIDDVDAQKRLKRSKMKFTDNLNELSKVDIAIICVPTPVTDDKQPDLSIVISASVNTAKKMKKGSLLVIESTINPGVCDEVITPEIEMKTQHKIGKTLHLAHCPERINPGDSKWHVGNINRVLGADSEESLEIAHDFYSSVIDAKIKKMASLKEAEAVKVVENSFRDINIAFVNELAMSFSKLGINTNNVIDGAATKPFSFMAHYPGIGVGGHCIPVDPYYLIEYAKSKGFEHKFLSLARNINENMPIYAIDSLEQLFIEKGLGDLKNKTVAILGLSYKPNVGDDRESPSFAVIDTLKERGAIVKTYDPHILDLSSDKTVEQAINGSDAVILSTAHDEFRKLQAEDFKDIQILLDGRNIYKKLQEKLDKHGVDYLGVGV